MTGMSEENRRKTGHSQMTTKALDFSIKLYKFIYFVFYVNC